MKDEGGRMKAGAKWASHSECSEWLGWVSCAEKAGSISNHRHRHNHMNLSDYWRIMFKTKDHENPEILKILIQTVEL